MVGSALAVGATLLAGAPLGPIGIGIAALQAALPWALPIITKFVAGKLPASAAPAFSAVADGVGLLVGAKGVGHLDVISMIGRVGEAMRPLAAHLADKPDEPVPPSITDAIIAEAAEARRLALAAFDEEMAKAKAEIAKG